MIVKEQVGGSCENCGKREHPDELYTDIFNHSYRMICHKCFYNLYGDIHGEKSYFRKVYNIDPRVLSYKTFREHNKDVIVVANAFPYFKKSFFSEDEIRAYKELSVGFFLGSAKINRKFKIVKSDCKANEQITPLDEFALIVGIRAWVRFNSYLEFLEHELHMKFRKECSATVQ